jgi:hypothetical protein
MKLDSAKGMSPNDLILFSSRLEMVDAVQSRLALAAPVVAPELAVPFFLPMVAGEVVEAEAMARRMQRKKMSSMGGVKSENVRVPLFITRND